jgi:hypothetical protein
MWMRARLPQFPAVLILIVFVTLALVVVIKLHLLAAWINH